MPTSTTTSTAIATTSTRIELSFERRGDATRAVRLEAHGLLRVRLLAPAGDVLRVALVQTAASLLAGDRVEISVACGPGARVEVVEVAGLVAHDARGGPRATLDVALTLEASARLAWAASPLVLAGGCELSRTIAVALEADAALLMRDTLVLGRAGEEPGRMRTATEVTRAGLPLHVETLDTGDRALLRSVAVLGDAKVLDTLALYGARADDPAALQLAGSGSVLPVPARSLAVAERTTLPALARWRTTLFAPNSTPEKEPPADELRVAVPTGRVA